MKNIRRNVFIGILLAACVLFTLPVKVLAATTIYTVTVPESATAGTEVTVPISIANNPGLTTLGLRMIYDTNIMEYKDAQWADGLSTGSNQMTLISDVEYGNGKALNISMIDGAGYNSDGVLVTLRFEVKADYAECPLELVLRDATDANENPVAGEIRYDKTGASIVTPNGSTVGSANNSAEDSKNESVGHNENAYDESFKTGVFVWTPLLWGGCIASGSVITVCAIHNCKVKKNGRRELQDIIGSGQD